MVFLKKTFYTEPQLVGIGCVFVRLQRRIFFGPTRSLLRGATFLLRLQLYPPPLFFKRLARNARCVRN